MPPNPQAKTVVLLKEQVIGSVKTRLGQKLGPEAAAAVYFILVQHILETLCNTPLIVSLKSDFNDGPIHNLCRTLSIPVHPQPKGDLGSAIYDAFTISERVVVLGGDMPLIPLKDIEIALNSDRLCLGPSEDGGYWLLAANSPPKALFEQIEWSSNKVLKQTCNIADFMDLDYRLLSTCYDIDTLQDLQRLINDPTTPSSLTKRLSPYARNNPIP